MIRPELRRAAWRARELLAGVVAVAAGLWGLVASGGLVRALAAVLLLTGAALAVIGWQRWRLRPDEDGVGLIEVDEAQITFWGPLTGGTIARDRLAALALNQTNHPPTWELVADTGEVLHIPVTAAGQDALLDAFAALPGLRMQTLLQARSAAPGDAPPAPRRRLWARSGAVDTPPASPHL